MRVLVDECAPKALKHFLTKQGHRCLTVQEAGWSGKQNGDLLAAAEPEFDVLITVDTNLRYQQNMEGRSIALPSWSSILFPTASRTFANTFPPAVWPLRKSSRVKSFELAVLFKRLVKRRCTFALMAMISKTHARLVWTPNSMGFRASPPPLRFTVPVHFQKDKEQAWSLNFDFSASPQDRTLVEVSFLSPEAPQDLLQPGSRFILFDGSASGEIID